MNSEREREIEFIFPLKIDIIISITEPILCEKSYLLLVEYAFNLRVKEITKNEASVLKSKSKDLCFNVPGRCYSSLINASNTKGIDKFLFIDINKNYFSFFLKLI